MIASFSLGSIVAYIFGSQWHKKDTATWYLHLLLQFLTAYLLSSNSRV